MRRLINFKRPKAATSQREHRLVSDGSREKVLGYTGAASKTILAPITTGDIAANGLRVQTAIQIG